MEAQKLSYQNNLVPELGDLQFLILLNLSKVQDQSWH